MVSTRDGCKKIKIKIRGTKRVFEKGIRFKERVSLKLLYCIFETINEDDDNIAIEIKI